MAWRLYLRYIQFVDYADRDIIWQIIWRKSHLKWGRICVKDAVEKK